MNVITSVLILLLGLSACDNNNNNNISLKCDAQNPLKEYTWLKELKESIKDSDVEKTIYQANYNKQIVFYLMVTDPRVRIAFGVTLWDCEGNVIKEFKSGESDEFEKFVVNRFVLYEHLPDEKD